MNTRASTLPRRMPSEKPLSPMPVAVSSSRASFTSSRSPSSSYQSPSPSRTLTSSPLAESEPDLVHGAQHRRPERRGVARAGAPEYRRRLRLLLHPPPLAAGLVPGGEHRVPPPARLPHLRQRSHVLGQPFRVDQHPDPGGGRRRPQLHPDGLGHRGAGLRP